MTTGSAPDELEIADVCLICEAEDPGLHRGLLRQCAELGYVFRNVLRPKDGALPWMARATSALNVSNVKVIALCIAFEGDEEDFGGFLIRAQAANKRVVVLRGGFGANSIDRTAWTDWLALRGAVATQTFTEFLDVALFLGLRDRPELPQGRGVAIVSGGGGNGVNAADLCAKYGLPAPPPSMETRERLLPLTPSIASLGNPYDLTPEMGSARYAGNYSEVLRIIADDPQIDTVFFPINALTNTRISQIGLFADFRRSDRADFLLAFNMLGREATLELARAHAYNFVEPERGVRAFARMIYCARRERGSISS